jgi:hypothetical protein
MGKFRTDDMFWVNFVGWFSFEIASNFRQKSPKSSRNDAVCGFAMIPENYRNEVVCGLAMRCVVRNDTECAG